MGFAVRLASQFANALALLLAVLVLNFFLIHLAPGDPVQVIAGEMGGASAQVVAELRAKYGLDHSLIEQLFTYLGKVITGDFGYSYYFNMPVLTLIGQRLPATLYLMLTSLLFAVTIGTSLGVISARKPNGIVSSFVTVFSLLGYAAPVFWT